MNNKILNWSLILLILFVSCKDNQQANDITSHTINQKVEEEINNAITKSQNSFSIDELIGHRLIGMESNQDEKEVDPYKKYSVDFTGACYSSDLCVIEINRTKLIISNYYDPKINLKFEITNIKPEEKRLIFKLENDSLTELSLTKFINNLSLYELKINGTISDEIRISKHLAKENIISKFGGIDCGDFDG
ncbi:hypothetical protein [uncultured Aquimarina sp.]|uniref:hypothetical protein n=1 Tax=uncultured Aquimarina sp. TaxID=575652 RepID=UPI002608BF96|nr:hypothetical protein [uncultured Aquimarina sp.]